MKNRICIVDSGISDPLDKGFLGGINLSTSNKKDIIDRNGHGTMCISTIRKIVPEVEYYVIKVFDNSLECSSLKLVEALNFLLKIDVKIINLSLSTPSRKYIKKFQSVCKKLHRQGKIIIASCDNRQNPSIPAECKYVIGIKGKLLNSLESFYYFPEEKIQCWADNTPIIVKGIDGDYSFFGGNSKAAACMTGNIVKLINTTMNSNNINIYRRLCLLTKKNITYINQKYIRECALKKNEVNRFPQDDIYKMEQVVIKILNIKVPKSLNIKLIYLDELGLNPFNVLHLLEEIEKLFHVNLDYENINFTNVNTIYALIKLVNQNRR